MTPNLPRLTGKELVAALARLGFQVIRVRGSHHFVRHAGLLNKVLRECEVSREELGRVL